MNYLIRHLVFIITCVPFLVCSQVKFTHYTTDSGLPHDFTYQLFQDDGGYLWIGTDDGLAKFNGNKFKVFDRSDGFRSNFIIDIKKYHGDTLAIATWKGGLHFMKNDSVLIPEVANDDIEKINRVYTVGKSILGSDFGRYVIYKNEKGLKFNKQELSIFTNNDEAILEPSNLENGVMSNNWNALVDDCVYFYRGVYGGFGKDSLKGIYRYKKDQEIELVFPFLKDKYVRDFGKYDAENYFGTVNNKVYVFNKDSIVKVDTYDLGNHLIHRFAKTSYCEVFVIKNISSGEDKIRVFDKKNNIMQNIKGRSKYQINVSDIYVDKDENIWITSKSDGLYQLSKEESIISEVVINDNDIIDIISSQDGKVFFLGLNRISGYHKESKELITKKFTSEIYGFRIDKIKNKKVPIDIFANNTINDSILSYKIRSGTGSIKEAAGVSISNKRIYFPPNQNRKRGTKIVIKEENIIINDIAIVDQEVWIATNMGIKVYDMTLHQYKRELVLRIESEILNIKKMTYAKKDGVWLATNSGLSRINQKGEVTYFTKKDGLESNKINDILLDHLGVLWIATQKGFSIYKGKMFYNFGKKEGLQSSSISKIIEDNENQIWIAGNKGAARIDNTKSFIAITPPNLIITKANDKFSVDVIDYSGKQITTEYRTNHQEAWRFFENKILDVENYGIGDYDIQFRSRNPISNWAYSKEYSFSIEQVWYKKLWFIICISLLSTTTVSSLIFYQLRIVNKRNTLLQDTIAQSIMLEEELNTVRENVAQDFHDELGNKLAGITVMSELMMKDEELKQTKSIHMISQVQKDAKDLYFGIKDFVWSIDAKSDDLTELMIYLSDFGEELFQNKGIIFKVEKHLNEQYIKLPYYWSRQLLLLFKEAMTNSLKHAKATEVVLGFYARDRVLKIRFSDNGLGFDPSKLKRKNGLVNMKKRTAKIGGKLIIDTKNGTVVLFRGTYK